MLTPKELDGLFVDFVEDKCYRGDSSCSTNLSYYVTTLSGVYCFCSYHFPQIKEHYTLVKFIKLSTKEVFYLKCQKR